jgi:hypothetical protein
MSERPIKEYKSHEKKIKIKYGSGDARFKFMDSKHNYIQINQEPPSIEQGWVPAYDGKFYARVMERMAENFLRSGFEVYVQLIEQKDKFSESLAEVNYRFFLRGKCKRKTTDGDCL